MIKITFVRHTRVAVENGTVYGFTDVDVAPSFPTEAGEVARKLKHETFDAVYSSPLSRCRKLAAFCGFPFPRIDERLKELNFGNWEMKPWDKIEDPILEKWYEDWLHIPAGGGECFLDQYRRVSRFLDELKRQPYRNVCLFVHSGVIHCGLIYAGLSGFGDTFSQEIPYGSIHTITVEPVK